MHYLLWVGFSVLCIVCVTRLILMFISPITDLALVAHAVSYRHTFIDPKTGQQHPFPSLLDTTKDAEHAAAISAAVTSPTAKRNNATNKSNNKSNAADATTQDSARVSLSIIVPCYNEQLRLPKMMDETIEFFELKAKRSKGSFTYELLLVDDGSKDRTKSVAMQYVERLGTDRVRLLQLTENQGKGGAVQQGMLHARGDLMLMCDADGATRIQDYDLVEQAMHQVIKQQQQSVSKASSDAATSHSAAPPCIVIGSRSHLQSSAVAQRAWYRNLLMHGFHFLVSSLCHLDDIRDTQCGFKLFTRSAARQLFANQHLRRWCFDVELLYIAHEERIPVVEVPVNWQEIAGSKVQLIESSLLMARDLVLIRVAYAMRIWNLQPFQEIQQSFGVHQFEFEKSRDLDDSEQ